MGPAHTYSYHVTGGADSGAFASRWHLWETRIQGLGWGQVTRWPPTCQGINNPIRLLPIDKLAYAPQRHKLAYAPLPPLLPVLLNHPDKHPHPSPVMPTPLPHSGVQGATRNYFTLLYHPRPVRTIPHSLWYIYSLYPGVPQPPPLRSLGFLPHFQAILSC